MAITDRKLFRNPRPARDTLNRMGGIMASSAPLMNQVQRFQNGGPIAILSGPQNYDTSSYGGLPTGLLNILPGVNISPPENERSTVPIYKAAPRSKTGTSLRGRSFIAPNRATNPGRAAELELARRALEGGLGSLSAGEQAYLTALMGKRSGGQLADSLTDYLGDSALSNIIQSVGEIGGTIAGGVGGSSYADASGTATSLTAGGATAGAGADGSVVICFVLPLPVNFVSFDAYELINAMMNLDLYRKVK